MAKTVTDAEVYIAIASLLKDGIPPNYITVREALGGRGSGPDLSRRIAAWYREFGPGMMQRLAAKRAEISQESPPGLVANTAGEIVSALQAFSSEIKADPGRGAGEMIEDVFEKIARLFDKMLAWERQLELQEVELTSLRARLIEIHRLQSTSKGALKGARLPKKSMPRP
ncbi:MULTISPECIES: hypothetical protein [Stenotrophomonas]|uniref:hypothetical protein n=1 Tax=Stenotrophomonas TaxID=40323 RepID=UPI00128DB77D|nr:MULTISPECIES: hypothetical protein [Stenotrophomonas]